MKQKLYNQNWIKVILYLVFSWMTAIAVSGVAGYRITEINIVIPMMMIGILFVVFSFDKIKEKKLCKTALWFAIPFALTLVLGSGFDMEERVFWGYSILTLIYFIILTIFFMMLTAYVMAQLEKFTVADVAGRNIRNKEIGKKEKKGTWMLASAISFVAWLPYYFTFFPGIVSPDYIQILNECVGKIPLTNHHPILFVLLINSIVTPCSKLWGMQVAVASVTVIHMLMFALLLGYMAHWLYEKGCGKVGYVWTVAFIAFNPVIAVFSVYITKDVLFGGIFLLYILKLYDIVASKGENIKNIKETMVFLGLNLLVVFLRNNGIYITLVLSVICLFIYRDMWKRIALCIVVVTVSYGLLKGPIFQNIGIVGESFAESLSVPLQQIAHTVVEDGEISQPDRDFLEKLMPLERVKEVYRPGYTDPYKFDAAFDDTFLNANKIEFLMVWARTLPRNLGSYIEAYLMQTAGYWHIGETDTLNPYGVIENDLGISQKDLFSRFFNISLQPMIEKVILACRKAPIICFITNMAFMVFMVYFICIQCFRNNKKCFVIPFLPLLLLWATVMIAAPAYCKFRYLFPFHLAYPFMIWILLCVSGKDVHRGER